MAWSEQEKKMGCVGRLFSSWSMKGESPTGRSTLGYGVLQLVVGVSMLVLKPIGIFPVVVFLGLAALGFVGVSYRVRKKVGMG